MDDILKYNVRTYVVKLIRREFSPKNNEENALSGNRKTHTGDYRKVRRSPAMSIISDKRTTSYVGEQT
jgi:hypothetical protein